MKLEEPVTDKSGANLTTSKPVLEVDSLSIFAGGRPLLQRISFSIAVHEVFGIIGPSGVGKTTLLRTLNRLLELDSELSVTGDIRFHGKSNFAGGTDVDALRAKIGMIFQQPVVFPTTVYKNVIFGLRHVTPLPKKQYPEVVEQALKEVSLWNQVKERLHESAEHLSLGQQQRLCLARTLAVDPEVILMDEPTSALDTQSTQAIEQLIYRLKETRTIVLVTHNLAQAKRLTHRVAALTAKDNIGRLAHLGPIHEWTEEGA